MQSSNGSVTVKWHTTVAHTENVEQFDAAAVKFYTGLSAGILLISVWILVANIMIISAPFVHKQLRRKTYMFISSLAAADLTTAFLVPAAWFMGVIAVFNYPFYMQMKSNTYCALIEVFYIFPMLCSIANLLLIACDRYLALCYPLKYNVLLTRHRSRMLIGGVWCFAGAMALVLLIWNNPQPNGELRCNGKDIAPQFLHFVLAPYAWITLIVMFFMYTRIYCTIRERNHSMPLNVQNNHRATNSDRKAAKMLFVTLAVFTICWTPFMVCLHLLMESVIELEVIYYPLSLAFLNSGMNFFIYCARCKQYRTAFKKMLPFRFSRENAEEPTHIINSIPSRSSPKSLSRSADRLGISTISLNQWT